MMPVMDKTKAKTKSCLVLLNKFSPALKICIVVFIILISFVTYGRYLNTHEYYLYNIESHETVGGWNADKRPIRPKNCSGCSMKPPYGFYFQEDIAHWMPGIPISLIFVASFMWVCNTKTYRNSIAFINVEIIYYSISAFFFAVSGILMIDSAIKVDEWAHPSFIVVHGDGKNRTKGQIFKQKTKFRETYTWYTWEITCGVFYIIIGLLCLIVVGIDWKRRRDMIRKNKPPIDNQRFAVALLTSVPSSNFGMNVPPPSPSGDKPTT